MFARGHRAQSAILDKCGRGFCAPASDCFSALSAPGQTPAAEGVIVPQSLATPSTVRTCVPTWTRFGHIVSHAQCPFACGSTKGRQ
eukprot:4230280-Pleurochrysis_carterae.AAC.1